MNGKRNLADGMKIPEFKIGRLSRILWKGPEESHEPLNPEEERESQRERDVAEGEVREIRSKRNLHPLLLGPSRESHMESKRRKQILPKTSELGRRPLAPQGNLSPADTLILAG